MGTNYSRYTKTEIAQSVISHVKTDIYIYLVSLNLPAETITINMLRNSPENRRKAFCSDNTLFTYIMLSETH